MKRFILLILLLCGCASTRESSTMQGLRILSDVPLSQSQLATLDECLKFAQGLGLKGDPSSMTIIIREGERTPGGNWGFKAPESSTGWAAGSTITCVPVMIMLVTQNLENLKHEFNHIILFQKTGDSDANHLDPSWKQYNLY